MPRQIMVSKPRHNYPVALAFFAAGRSSGISWVTAQLQRAGKAPFVGRTVRQPADDPRGQGRWIVFFNVPPGVLGGAASITCDLVVFDENNAEQKRLHNIVVHAPSGARPTQSREGVKEGGFRRPLLAITPSPNNQDCLTAYCPDGTLDDGENSITQAWVEKPQGTVVQNADFLWPDPDARVWIAQFPDLTNVSGGGAGNYWLTVVSDIGTQATYGPVDLESTFCDVS